ncbi:hypothetical protein B4U79_17785 [Dinothrombium tinctorium]|uniref:Uncharacterized protein n=1 Tax=Dinothrombium tinctorium TaxID=1965070 RepID=A0A3S3P596_9ACAR|nr:hypothetical protein B4U79_17785 [Dinothrombium tinctorium]
MDSATLGVDRPQHRYDLRPRTKRVLYFAQSSLNKFISLNDKSVKALTSKYSSSLKCLNLSCGEYTLEIRETTLMAVIKSCEKLEELKLGRCSKITGKCFREFRNSLKKLQLDFASDIWAGSTFGYLREIASGESHQSLTSLDLKWNINTCCVNIIRYCNQIIPDLVQDPIELFSNRFCNLTILKWDLPSVHHKPGNFKVLSKLTKLEELYLTGCDDYSVNDDSLTQIMSSCVNISIFEIKGIYNPFFPEPQTQELHGITEKYLTDVSLKKLPFLCRKMKSLKLSWVKSQKITDEFLVSLASHKNLQSVNLEQLTNITEEGVVKLITTSKNIRYLTFSECTLLTKQVIDSIINKIHSSKLNMNLTFIQNKQTYCHPGFSVNHNFQL